MWTRVTCTYAHINRLAEVSESFFAYLRKETVHWTHFHTRDEARQKIFAYIEGFYDTEEFKNGSGT